MLRTAAYVLTLVLIQTVHRPVDRHQAEPFLTLADRSMGCRQAQLRAVAVIEPAQQTILRMLVTEKRILHLYQLFISWSKTNCLPSVLAVKHIVAGLS